MNKTIKIWGIFSLFLTIGLMLFGCVSNQTTADPNGTFTVRFVDYDGTVLKTTTCTVGVPCDIVPPAAPVNRGGNSNRVFTHWSVFSTEYASLNSDTDIEAVYTLDRAIFSINGRAVVWYSVLIMAGIMTAFLIGMRESKRLGIDGDVLIDGFLWIVPVAILGARLWYVAFEFNAFVVQGDIGATLLKILGFQNGRLNFAEFGLAGLAIHGAFFTAVICAFFYSRKRKINLLQVADLVGAGFIVAQTFGRWGNFLNQEAHGGLVGGMTGLTANWSLQQQYEFLRYTLHLPDFIVHNMYIIGNVFDATEPVTGFYHPTFLYELLLNWVGFFIILILRRIKWFRFGEMMAFYLVWYGAVRIFIESMRTDPLVYHIFGVTVKAATTTSVLMILGGVALSLAIRLWWKGESYGTVPGHFGFRKKPQEIRG